MNQNDMNINWHIKYKIAQLHIVLTANKPSQSTIRFQILISSQTICLQGNQKPRTDNSLKFFAVTIIFTCSSKHTRYIQF